MKRYIRYKLLAFFMTLMMMVSMIPSAVFAEGMVPLEGKLKIKGDPIVGTELCVDYEEVVPQGLSEEQVKFLWMRTTLDAEEEAELTQTENITREEIGKESKYTLTFDDVGCIVILRITGLEEYGITGFIEAKTEVIDEAESMEEVEEELIPEEEYEQEVLLDDIPVMEETIAEEIPVEEVVIPEEVIPEEVPVMDETILEEVPVVEETIPEETLAMDETVSEETPVGDETVPEEIPVMDETVSEETPVMDETVPEEISVLEETIADEIILDEMEQENADSTGENLIEEIIVEEMTFNADGTVAEEVVYGIETDLEENKCDFGKFIIGQENIVEPKKIILTNTGTGAISIELPELEWFIISKVNPEDPDVLSEGSQIEYYIMPNLAAVSEANIYQQEIEMGVEASVLITASFEVAEPEPIEESTVTPEPEPTEEPTATPEPEPTEEPTVTPEPEPTEEPTVTPEPEPTEEPTATPEPEPTEEPTATPEPEPTEAPTSTPEPTPTETPELITAIALQPAAHNFGVVEVGYKEAPDAQYITIINSGDTTLNLIQPVSEYYVIGELESLVLEAGNSISFTVRPKSGLEKGNYDEVIYVETAEGVSEMVVLSFAVTSKTVKLQGIEKPSDISGLKNGVKKTEQALQLPATVTISTTNGNMKANVVWDLEACEYNRKSVKAQTFTVSGKVTLPKGIENPDGISLKVSVTVTVNAYAPKIADASQNVITGISTEKYTTQSKITFTAMGAGMNNENPRKGDVRYCPVSWGVFNTNNWKGAPYSAAFGMGQAGSYNLTVIYNRQQYDGESWVNTGEQDKKTVSFEVVQAEDGVNLTPTPEKHDTNQKEAVATGDTTVILPLIIALIVALTCVIVVLIYKKRR